MPLLYIPKIHVHRYLHTPQIGASVFVAPFWSLPSTYLSCTVYGDYSSSLNSAEATNEDGTKVSSDEIQLLSHHNRGPPWAVASQSKCRNSKPDAQLAWVYRVCTYVCTEYNVLRIYYHGVVIAEAAHVH